MTKMKKLQLQNVLVRRLQEFEMTLSCWQDHDQAYQSLVAFFPGNGDAAGIAASCWNSSWPNDCGVWHVGPLD